jgi:hypothetical protein
MKTVTYFNDQEIINNINNFGLSGKDAQIYKEYILEFVNKLQSNNILMQNKNNNKDDFSIELFNIVATLNLYNIFILPSLSC